MAISVLDDRLLELVDEGVEVVRLADVGARPCEGPIWIAEAEHLVFSDVLGSARWRWDERSGARQIATDTGQANGMTRDLEGRLIVCVGAEGQVLRMAADATGSDAEVIASHFEGKRLNNPNDVVVASDGSIYFSDPWTAPLTGLDREQELTVQAVYRIAPDGTLHQLVDDFAFPNGLCFSPDESILYVDDEERFHIRAFDVQADGSLANGRLFAEGIYDEEAWATATMLELSKAARSGGPSPDTWAPRRGLPDGMKCDEHGNVWVTGPYGIWVFSPAGEHLGIIEIPQKAQNLHWGGHGWGSLFVTASTGVYRFEPKVSGRREPFMAGQRMRERS